MLSAAKHLAAPSNQILRCAQDDIVRSLRLMPIGWGQAPPLLYTGLASRSSVEKGRAWRSPCQVHWFTTLLYSPAYLAI